MEFCMTASNRRARAKARPAVAGAILMILMPLAFGARARQSPATLPAARPVVKEVTEYDEYTGRFSAVNRVEVRARVGGYLSEVRFSGGEIVQQGDLLVVIDQRPFRIAQDAAEAELAEVQAELDLARQEAERARKLRKDLAISQEDLDRRVQQELAAGARLARVQAAVDKAKLDMEYTEVRAPIHGRVGRRLIDAGNLVTGGGAQGDLITTIVQEDPIHFYFDVSEADYLRYTRMSERGVRPSSRTTPNAVSIKLLDEQTFAHHGVMDFVDNELDPSSGTLEARAVLSNRSGLLQPGVFGRLRLLGSGTYEAVLIPDTLVQFDQSRRFVYTIGEDGTVGRSFIELGPMIDGLRLIRSGLEGDEVLVANAFHRVRLGAVVKPEFDDGRGGAR
jgi:RND family efflux transporter MFP subunit